MAMDDSQPPVTYSPICQLTAEDRAQLGFEAFTIIAQAREAIDVEI